MIKEDKRSKKFIFVPFCLICQAFQARGIVKHSFDKTFGPIVKELIGRNINIIQMPCPESRFKGYKEGLNRQPQGLKAYSTASFKKFCDKLALETSEMVEGILFNNYKIIAILGIEYSPSCAVRLQYTNKGTIHQSGIFIKSLKKRLSEKKIKVAFVGINRRSYQKSLSRIKELL